MSACENWCDQEIIQQYTQTHTHEHGDRDRDRDTGTNEFPMNFVTFIRFVQIIEH